ncbi:MAG: hypothetical protein JSW39_00015 [Desulfobacterales bacterium]|nr:MAG: hypothetical protein JSW39_00015 [Desulfobacterales bacterium]
MKKIALLPWLLAFFLVFGFSGTTFAGGGPEDPACPAGTEEDPLPEPDAGKFLRGGFTVARAVGLMGDIFYSVHIDLKKGDERHLFSFQSALGLGDLCSLSADELTEIFKRVPCTLGVAETFGLEGIPVIASLEIVQVDFCDTAAEMIRGEIVVRVVPVD